MDAKQINDVITGIHRTVRSADQPDYKSYTLGSNDYCYLK